MRRERDLGIVAGPRSTVAQYLEWWLDHVAAPTVRAVTLKGYAERVRAHLIPALGDHRLDRLTPQHVERMLARLPLSKSPRSVAHVRSVLQNALRYAEQTGLVSRNVARLTRPPRVPNVERLTLTPPQVLTLFDALEGDRLRALYVVTAALGLRQSEVLGLRWADTDLEAHTLRIEQTLRRLGGEWVYEPPKSLRGRRPIPLPGFVAEALEAHRAVQEAEAVVLAGIWEPTDLVFVAQRGGPLHGPKVNLHLRTVLADAGLPRVTFHDLRHAAASLLQSLGAAPRVMMEILGHAQIGTTMNVYTHVPDQLAREAVERMDAWYRSGDSTNDSTTVEDGALGGRF